MQGLSYTVIRDRAKQEHSWSTLRVVLKNTVCFAAGVLGKRGAP